MLSTFCFLEVFIIGVYVLASPFPKQGHLPLSDTVLIPLNIQIPAFYILFRFFISYSFQRNSLHLSFIPIRSNIARKPSDWCRQINSVFLHPSVCYFTNSVCILFSDYTKHVVVLMFLFFLLVFSPIIFLKCLAVYWTRAWNKPNQYFTVMHNALPLVLSERSVNSVTVFVAQLDVFSIFCKILRGFVIPPYPRSGLHTLTVCIIPDSLYIRHTCTFPLMLTFIWLARANHLLAD
jgi:hypothetical protein